MTPIQQQIAIANLRRWTDLAPSGCPRGNVTGYRPIREIQEEGRYFEAIPKYLSDLNAMYEAEKMLTSERDCERYKEILTTIVNGFYSDPFRGVAGYLFHATAAQRAQAFLRTLNLWTHP